MRFLFLILAAGLLLLCSFGVQFGPAHLGWLGLALIPVGLMVSTDWPFSKTA